MLKRSTNKNILTVGVVVSSLYLGTVACGHGHDGGTPKPQAKPSGGAPYYAPSGSFTETLKKDNQLIITYPGSRDGGGYAQYLRLFCVGKNLVTIAESVYTNVGDSVSMVADPVVCADSKITKADLPLIAPDLP